MGLFGPKKKKIPQYVQLLASGSVSQRQDAVNNLYKLVTDASDLSKRQEVAKCAQVFPTLINNLPQIQLIGNILECLAADPTCAEEMAQSHAIDSLIALLNMQPQANKRSTATTTIQHQPAARPRVAVVVVLRILFQLSSHPSQSVQIVLVTSSLVQNLMQCTALMDNECVAVCCAVLDNLMNMNGDRGACRIGQQNGVTLLLQMVHDHASDSSEKPLQTLAKLLQNRHVEQTFLTKKDIQKIHILTDHVNLQVAASATGLVGSLGPDANGEDMMVLKYLRRLHSSVPANQSLAMERLSKIATNYPAARHDIVSGGENEALPKKILTFWKDNAKTDQQNAAHLLHMLVQEEQCALQIISVQVIAALIKFIQDKKERSAAFDILHQLASLRNRQIKWSLVEADIIPFMVSYGMKRRVPMGGACSILLNICHDNEENRLLMAQNGGVLFLFRCLQEKRGEFALDAMLTLQEMIKSRQVAKMVLEADALNKIDLSVNRCSDPKVAELWQTLRPDLETIKAGGTPSFANGDTQSSKEDAPHVMGSRTGRFADLISIESLTMSDGFSNPHGERLTQSSSPRGTLPQAKPEPMRRSLQQDQGVSAPSTMRSPRFHSNSPKPTEPPHPVKTASPSPAPHVLRSTSTSGASDSTGSNSTPLSVDDETLSIDVLLSRIRTSDSNIVKQNALDQLMQSETIEVIQQIMAQNGCALLLDCWSGSVDAQIQQKAAECLLLFAQHNIMASQMVSERAVLLQLFRIIEQGNQQEIAMDLLIVLFETATEQVKKEFVQASSSLPTALIRCMDHKTHSVGIKIAQMVAFLCYNDEEMRRLVLNCGFLDAIDRLLQRCHQENNAAREIVILLEVLQELSVDHLVLSHLILKGFASRLQVFCRYEGSVGTLAQDIFSQINQLQQSQRKATPARPTGVSHSDSSPLPSYSEAVESLKRPASVPSLGQQIKQAPSMLPPPPVYQEPTATKPNVVVVVVENKAYEYDNTRDSVLDGRNAVFKCVSKGVFIESCCIKIYDTGKGHDDREINNLRDMFKSCDAIKFLVEPVGFDRNILMNNEPTCKSALVMKLGKRNLKEMLQGEGIPKDQTVPIMKKIAECVNFVHDQGFVYGDLKLENVVNFGNEIPVFKLVDFENCCKVNQRMAMDFTAEYCPPEMAIHALEGHNNTLALLRAEFSFDVWSFGVLWMKYSLRGNALMEFEDLSPQQILATLANPKFSFDRTLKRLSLSSPVESLVRQCLSRDPLKRPGFKDILKNHVIKGYNTTLQKMSEQGNQAFEYLVHVEQVITNMLQGQERLIWGVDHVTLPILWILVPRHDEPENPTRMPSKLSRLFNKELELKMICDDAFDSTNNVRCCPCPAKYRIKIKHSSDFVVKCLPILKAASMLLKLAGVGGVLMGVPGLGMVGDKLKEVVDSNAVGMIETLLTSTATKDDQAIDALSERVDRLVDVVSSTKDMNQEMQQMSHKSLQAMQLQIRHHVVSERLEQMHSILRMADAERDWHRAKIIGGLERVRVVHGPNRGQVHWVCANHARCHQYHDTQVSPLGYQRRFHQAYAA